MFVLLVTIFIEQKTNAHPVIFKDGVVVSSSNMVSYSDNQLMYSFSHKISTGLNYWRFSTEEKHLEFGFIKLNYLLKRFHLTDSQGNIYLHGGLGGMFSNVDTIKTQMASLVGIETDWETRKVFASLKYFYFNPQDIDGLSMAQARLGFSTFESGFDELQSWFMLQIMSMTGDNSADNLVVTPLMRFFYKNILWEIGSSTRGEWMINLMVHY